MAVRKIILGLAGALFIALLVSSFASNFGGSIVALIWASLIFALILALWLAFKTFSDNTDIAFALLAGSVFHFIGTVGLAWAQLQFGNVDAIAPFVVAPKTGWDWLFYSLDQTLRGVTFDIVEGLEIDLFTIISDMSGLELSPVEATPMSPIAFFNAVFRSTIGAAISVLLLRPFLGRRQNS